MSLSKKIILVFYGINLYFKRVDGYEKYNYAIRGWSDDSILIKTKINFRLPTQIIFKIYLNNFNLLLLYKEDKKYLFQSFLYIFF